MLKNINKRITLKEGSIQILSIAANIPEQFYNEECTDTIFIAKGIHDDNLKDYLIEFKTTEPQTIENALSSNWKEYKVYTKSMNESNYK